MKKIAVAVSLIFILNLFTFMPVLAEEEIIAQPSVAAGNSHVLGLNQYGRVFSAGDNTYGQCLTFNWIDITQICAGKYFSAGLCSDGTVVLTGKQKNAGEFLDIDVSGLSSIVQISAGDNFLAALDVDGNVFINGNDDSGNIETSQWTDIVEIACGKDHVVGLKSDGSCVGSGRGGESNVSSFSEIEAVYAGADLTVLKDVKGVYYHAGSTVDVPEYDEFDTYWQRRDWTNIEDIIIFPDLSGNGIVTAIKSDGTIVTDANDIVKSDNLSNVKNLAVSKNISGQYAICLTNENDIEINGDMALDLEMNIEYLNDVEKFDLQMKPLREVYIKKPQIVVSNNTVAFVLPNGQVKSIGKQDLSHFEEIKQLSADMGFGSDDVFIGVDKDGKAVSNLENSDWIDDWIGVLKVAPTVCNTNQNIAVAIRWDKRMLYYYKSGSAEEEYVIEKNNVVDAACGNYFITYLTDTGNVGVEEIQTASGREAFDTKSWSNIERISSSIYHIVGLKNDGTCVATGGYKYRTGECDVENWSDIKDVLCGEGFTIGLKNDGTCEFACWDKTSQNNLKNVILKAAETDTEYWENVSEIYASKKTIVANKTDGTFEYATMSSQDLSQLKNTYYKDNVFYTYKIDGNTATIEYYSDEELEAYLTYFDASGNPVDFEKVTLEPNDTLTKVVCTSEKAAESCTMSIGEPTSKKMKFYIEEETESDGIALRYCADEGRRVTVTFYDEKNNMMDVKVKTLPTSDAMTTINYSCIDAAKYKLFIWDGVTPLYKSEGFLN